MGRANTSNPAGSVVEEVWPGRHGGDYEGFGGVMLVHRGYEMRGLWSR